MFGLYELLTICAFYTLGYNAAFYAILGILVHDVAYRINTEIAICIGLVGLYLINIFGPINTLLFVATIFSCFSWRDNLKYIAEQASGLRDRLETTPQGQRLLAGVFTVVTFVTMLFNVITSSSYIKPYMDSQRWIELGRSIRDGGYESHASLYSFTSTMIRDPIIEKGGVRAERILSCWVIIRREIITFITINRVRLAQLLIGGKSYAPTIIAFAKNFSDNSKSDNSTKKSPTVKNSIQNQSDTMDLMRDFIETKEAMPETIVPVQTATVKREQRKAVESAMMAPAKITYDDDQLLPENKAGIKKVILSGLAKKGIIWAKQTQQQRATHIENFSKIFKDMNVNLSPEALSKILNSK